MASASCWRPSNRFHIGPGILPALLDYARQVHRLDVRPNRQYRAPGRSGAGADAVQFVTPRQVLADAVQVRLMRRPSGWPRRKQTFGERSDFQMQPAGRVPRAAG
jgi:hypothetical protein